MKRILLLILGVITFVLIVPMTVILMPGGNLPNETEGMEITVLLNGEKTKKDLNDYLFGVVAAEMPASFHEEALKAQAVAARTYIINKHNNPDPDHADVDVCNDSTHCKAYLQGDEIKEKFGEKWEEEYGGKIRSAVRDTEDIIAVYKGEPIEAVFHSTSSGITENAKDVWGSDVDYLVSCESPGDIYSPKYSEDIYINFENFTALMEGAGYSVAPYVGECERNKSGSVKSIDIGGVVLSGVRVREIFSLPSANFTVSAIDDGFTFSCKGRGHGVGMSQYGADYFAKEGKTYEEILKIYYKGIELEKYEHINRDNKN